MLHFPRFTASDLKLLATRPGYRATCKTHDLYEVVGQDGMTRATFFKNRHGYGVTDSLGVEVINAQPELLALFRNPFHLSAAIKRSC